MSLVGKFGLLLPNGACARIAQHWPSVTAGNMQNPYILSRVLTRTTATAMALGYDRGTWSVNFKRAMAARNNGEIQY